MASGDTLFVLSPLGSVPPATVYATLDVLSDTVDVPLVGFPVLDFDGAANESADWHVVIPSHYAGTTGFTFAYHYAVDGSVAGTVEWEVRVLNLTDLDILTGDLGMDGLTAATLTDTLPATAINKFNVTTTVALAKASMGTPAAGDQIVIRVTRDPVTDTCTDDAQLLAVYVTET